MNTLSLSFRRSELHTGAQTMQRAARHFECAEMTLTFKKVTSEDSLRQVLHVFPGTGLKRKTSLLGRSYALRFVGHPHVGAQLLRMLDWTRAIA